MAVLEPQHADIVAALRDLQQDQAFTDFTIHLKEGPVHVSRIHLAVLSPVFRNMLNADMTEARTNSVAMEHISRETWTCITEFYYSSQKLVTIDNVVDVLEASHMYELDRLTQYCSVYLQSICSPENCLDIKRMAAKLSLLSVARKARKVIANDFSAVCKSADFLRLEKSELLELLEKEELVTTEDDVCEALLAWMEAKDADADTCTELFQHVRLGKVSDDFLGNSVMYHSVSTRTPAIQVKVREEFTARLNSGRKRSPGAPHRRPIPVVDGTLVVVGEEPLGRLFALLWSPTGKKWTGFPDHQRFELHSASVATSDGTVFMTGRQGFFKSIDIHLFDVHDGTWSAGPKLKESRGDHGMAVIRDRVFVVAGSVAGLLRTIYLNTVEEFSQTTRQWMHVGNLKVATHKCGVTALGDTILVAGGDTDESQSLIQTFNVETRAAAVLDARLPRPMRYIRAARLGNSAFFVGNEGDLVQITEVEGEFQMTSHVQLQEFGTKWWFGLQVTDTCVRVIGGNKSQSVVCWNHQGNRVENDEVADLPEKMHVYGVHGVDCFSP